MATEKKTTEEFSIEDAMKRIEEINGLLAQEGTSLKDSLTLYEEGVLLSEKCRKSIEGIETQIKIIGETDED